MSSSSSAKDSRRESVLDVNVEKLARVYAQAALDAAGDQEGNVLEELRDTVSEVLDKHREMEQIFSSALISIDEKLEMLDRLFGSVLSPTTMSFLKVLTKHDRLGILRQVVRVAGALWERRSNRVPVQLELAQAIDDGLYSELVSSLGSSLGIEPVVTTSINPDLIAGFTVRVGDRVYDASTRSSLERARQAMVARAVEAIQTHPDQFMDKSEN